MTSARALLPGSQATSKEILYLKESIYRMSAESRSIQQKLSTWKALTNLPLEQFACRQIRLNGAVIYITDAGVAYNHD
jgi:hypothetical protein